MKQIAFNFYSNLFHKNIIFDEDATLAFLNSAELPTISVHIADLIDAKFTAEEFIVVLHDFLANKKGKSTGEDGLPANLYANETLRPIFAALLADIANHIASKGSLPENLARNFLD